MIKIFFDKLWCILCYGRSTMDLYKKKINKIFEKDGENRRIIAINYTTLKNKVLKYIASYSSPCDLLNKG